MIMPQSVKDWLSSLWISIRDFFVGKSKVYEDDETKRSEDVVQACCWEEIAKAPIAVVDFGAEWCGPCRRISPVFNQLATEYKGKARFFSVDIDQYQNLASDQGVTSIPAFHIYKEGEIVGKLVGANTSSLRALVEKLV